MYSLIKNKIISFLLLGLVILACSSQEYTSAKLYIQNEDWEKTGEFLLKALVVEPENPEIPVQIGFHVYGRNQDWIKMNEMFDLALKLGAETTILSGKTTREYIENFRDMFWAEAYNKGVKIFNIYKESRKLEELKEAVEIFEITKEVKSDEIQSYSILVTCYTLLEDMDKALENADKALELKPDDFQPNLALGVLLIKQEKKSEALTYLEKAVEIDGGNSYAVRQLATAYYDLNFTEKSIETFEKAIESETDKKIKADLYFNLGVLNMRIKDFGKAEDNFLSAYDLNPDDAEALVGMAQTFENAEKWSRAEKFYRELIALEPDQPEHYKGMARVLIKNGDPERATRYYEKSKNVGN